MNTEMTKWLILKNFNEYPNLARCLIRENKKNAEYMYQFYEDNLVLTLTMSIGKNKHLYCDVKLQDSETVKFAGSSFYSFEKMIELLIGTISYEEHIEVGNDTIEFWFDSISYFISHSEPYKVLRTKISSHKIATYHRQVQKLEIESAYQKGGYFEHLNEMKNSGTKYIDFVPTSMFEDKLKNTSFLFTSNNALLEMNVVNALLNVKYNADESTMARMISELSKALQG